MMTDKEADRPRDAHDFLVAQVEPAPAGDGLAVTLVDKRGGRVTLHLDKATARRLRNMLAEIAD